MEQINIDTFQRGISTDSYLSNIRKSGYVPGVLYGNNNSNKSVQINNKELLKQLKNHGKSGIFQITLEGEAILVKLNEIQRDPLSKEIIHIDLQSIDLDQVISISVPIQLIGQPIGVKNGGTLQQQLRDLEIKGLPSLVPDSIHIDITDLDIGEAIYVKDIIIANDIELLNDPSVIILSIIPPIVLDDENKQADTIKAEPDIVDAKDGRGIDAAK